MAEAVVVDTLERIAVDSQINPATLSSFTQNGREVRREDGKSPSEAIDLVEEDGIDRSRVRFECVDLDGNDNDDDLDGDDEDDEDGQHDNVTKKKRLKKKKPKHVLFEDGSSSEEESNSVATDNIDPSDLTWVLWMWYYLAAASSGALKVAEFLGEKLAAFFGITTPKYQYVIDEYYRLKQLEREEEEQEQRERELLAERKLKDLSQLEGGDANFESNKQLP